MVAEDESEATLALFMHARARDRWRGRSAPNARAFRNQQYAPPERLPDDAIELYTAGDADTRKKDAPPPPAGLGVVAVERGRKIIFHVGDQIVARRAPHAHVKTTTSNLAELVAFGRALEWAHNDPLAADRPICIRYTSEYAARIATGAWRAKKHKETAAAAQQAWKRLRERKAGKVWMRHTPRTAPPWSVANSLAENGKGGTRVYGRA